MAGFKEVLLNNQNLVVAASNVDAAAALAVQAGAALKPTVGLVAGSSSTDAGGLPTTLESSNAFLNVSWELDLWGRQARELAAVPASSPDR